MNAIFSKNDTGFNSKPSSFQIGEIQNQGFSPLKTSLEDFKTHIEAGKSFLLPAFLKPLSPSIDDFVCQTMFAVDIDGTITLAEAKDMLEDFRISYTFGYYTFSHQDAAKPRFRLVFTMDGEVRSAELAKPSIRHSSGYSTTKLTVIV